jgi:hypothetical protein
VQARSPGIKDNLGQNRLCDISRSPTPYNSGGSNRDRRIGNAGYACARHYAVELAWLWLRNQPSSLLTPWFKERIATAKGRIRRFAIVALARKLIPARHQNGCVVEMIELFYGKKRVRDSKIATDLTKSIPGEVSPSEMGAFKISHRLVWSSFRNAIVAAIDFLRLVLEGAQVAFVNPLERLRIG